MTRLIRSSVLLLVALSLVPVASAVSLGKFKDWASSPTAYFMTAAEREQWKRLSSEAEAEQFVASYTAARGGEKFTAEVAKRVAMADKYLTVGNTPGSKTTRGKVVILFGPPTAMDVKVKPIRAGRSGSASVATGGAVSDARGASVAEMSDVGIRDGMAGGDLHTYTFTYAAASLPTKQDLTFAIELNTFSGKERVADKNQAAALDRAFEAAAQASIVTK